MTGLIGPKLGTGQGVDVTGQDIEVVFAPDHLTSGQGPGPGTAAKEVASPIDGGQVMLGGSDDWSWPRDSGLILQFIARGVMSFRVGVGS